MIKKSNLHYTCGITPKLVTIDGARHRGLAPEQHSYEETSQRWPVVCNTVSGLTNPEIEPQTSHTDSDKLNNWPNRPVISDERYEISSFYGKIIFIDTEGMSFTTNFIKKKTF